MTSVMVTIHCHRYEVNNTTIAFGSGLAVLRRRRDIPMWRNIAEGVKVSCLNQFPAVQQTIVWNIKK